MVGGDAQFRFGRGESSVRGGDGVPVGPASTLQPAAHVELAEEAGGEQHADQPAADFGSDPNRGLIIFMCWRRRVISDTARIGF